MREGTLRPTLYTVLGIVVLLVVAFAAWFFWPVSSRRKSELANPATRFHWGVIATYMGHADPTQLPRDEAARILSGWSCNDASALRQKMSAYASGEINTAFDVARIVWLSELGIAAGYMPLAEREQWSGPALTRVRGAYAGWQPFAEDLAVGRQRWWTEVAGSAQPEQDRARAIAVRTEAASVVASIPWGG